MPQISVIVPVYNTERFLCKCLDSILNQTYDDFELIIIDDGSTDSSGQICEDYLLRDKRIHVFHTSNQGLPSARKYGIGKSCGKYIQHIDSDDWIELDMLEKLIIKAESEDLELIASNFIWELPNESKLINFSYKNKEDIFRDVISGNWGTIWKIFAKKSLYSNKEFYFPQGITGGEDYVTVTQLLYWANNIGFIDDNLYHYNSKNPTSYISNTSLHRVFDQINSTKIVESFLEEHNLKSHYLEELTERKIWSKAPLATNNWDLWLQVFPEVNELAIKPQKGKRAWLRKMLKKLADKF